MTLLLLGWMLIGSVASAASGDAPALTHPNHAQVVHVLVTANKAEVDDGNWRSPICLPHERGVEACLREARGLPRSLVRRLGRAVEAPA